MRRGWRSALCVLAVAAGCGQTLAADFNDVQTGDRPPLFIPTNPDSVASDFPRSPLEDLVVNRFARFSTRREAQAHCLTDIVVWVGFGSNHYRLAGRGSADGLGATMCQADASAEGDRP